MSESSTPMLAKVMVVKGGVYLLAGLAIWPGGATVGSQRLSPVLAILALFFSLAAALGLLASRGATRQQRVRKALLIGGIASLLCAAVQAYFGISGFVAAMSQQSPQP